MLAGDPATALESRVRLARIGFGSRVTVEELAQLVGMMPEIQLVDVRNPGETAVAGTITGARVIPLPVLVDSLDQLDRDAPVMVNCAGGYRSLIAASLLRQAGFSDVSDLVGGFGAWAAAGLPVARNDHASTPGRGRLARPYDGPIRLAPA